MSTLRHAQPAHYAHQRPGKHAGHVYPADPASVRLARRLVTTVLSEWGLAVLADDGGLIADELAANAVRQSIMAAGVTAEILVRVSRTERHVTIQVGDNNPAAPPRPPRRVPGCAESGRGLMISAALAEQLGWFREADWKIVWAALAVPRQRHARHASREQLRPAA